MPWLKDVNPHPLDHVVVFAEENHRYTYTPTGERVRKSMTAVLKPIFDTFDAVEVARQWVPKWLKMDGGAVPENAHRYHHMCRGRQLVEGEDEEEIVQYMAKYWAANGLEAAAEGTKVHRDLELYVQGELPPPSTDEPPPQCVAGYIGWREWWYPGLKLEPWRVEFSMVLTTTVQTDAGAVEIPVVSGQIDLVMRSRTTGKYILLDWKNTDVNKKGKIGQKKLARGKRCFPDARAQAPFNDFDANDFSKYSAQLLGYKYMLEKGGYFAPGEIVGCYIVQVHRDLDRFHVIEAAEGLDDSFEECVDEMMTQECILAREEYLAKHPLAGVPEGGA